MKHLILLLAFAVATALSSPSTFRLAPLFSDNMVLQQKSEVPFWGGGSPGNLVTILTSWGERGSTEVMSDGTWLLRVTTPPAGGPYYVTCTSGNESVALQNVMSGEVWLCSGQSNMEMPLQGWPPADTILGSAEAIRTSARPEIRLFTVRHAVSPSPEPLCEGTWVEASPSTTPPFSATAYFFGRALHDSLRVPIGLIVACWGGTPVEAWTSMEYLSRFGDLDTTLAKIRQSRAGMIKLQEWLDHLPTVNMRERNGAEKWKGLDFRDAACAAPGFDDSAWGEMRLPTLWEETPLGEFDGAVWFRRRVEIPSGWLHQELILDLGPIDDMDLTFVNGKVIDGIEVEGKWKAERSYRVPMELVDTTSLVIAVRVLDPMGGGGIYGDAQLLSLRRGGERIPLAGSWRFRPVAEYRGEKFFSLGPGADGFDSRPRLAIEVSAKSPTALFNGMISPLLPFTLRGVIWYQGESNVSAASIYASRFSAMIRDWRTAFQNPELPFYFTQIAPYGYSESQRSQLLREAQLKTLSIGQSGMAVTLDIGNPSNIHPANKSEVGRRLALCALEQTYGRRLSSSGPVYASMIREGDRAVLSFAHAERGLKLRRNSQGSGFQIAGGDSVFVNAEVAIHGQRLVVWRPGIRKPLAVRYAFTNAPEATLFGADGLPASSFRTDDWAR